MFWFTFVKQIIKIEKLKNLMCFVIKITNLFNFKFSKIVTAAHVPETYTYYKNTNKKTCKTTTFQKSWHDKPSFQWINRKKTSTKIRRRKNIFNLSWFHCAVNLHWTSNKKFYRNIFMPTYQT